MEVVNNPDELVVFLFLPPILHLLIHGAHIPDTVFVGEADTIVPAHALQGRKGAGFHRECDKAPVGGIALGNTHERDARIVGKVAQRIAQRGAVETEHLGGLTPETGGGDIPRSVVRVGRVGRRLHDKRGGLLPEGNARQGQE